jgi:hypothetical protein
MKSARKIWIHVASRNKFIWARTISKIGKKLFSITGTVGAA